MRKLTLIVLIMTGCAPSNQGKHLMPLFDKGRFEQANACNQLSEMKWGESTYRAEVRLINRLERLKEEKKEQIPYSCTLLLRNRMEHACDRYASYGYNRPGFCKTPDDIYLERLANEPKKPKSNKPYATTMDFSDTCSKACRPNCIGAAESIVDNNRIDVFNRNHVDTLQSGIDECISRCKANCPDYESVPNAR